MPLHRGSGFPPPGGVRAPTTAESGDEPTEQPAEPSSRGSRGWVVGLGGVDASGDPTPSTASRLETAHLGRVVDVASDRRFSLHSRRQNPGCRMRR